MPSDSDQSQAKLITEAISRILAAGSSGVLATIVAAPESVGAKLLLAAERTLVGKIEPTEVRDEIGRQAAMFLDSGQDTRTLSFTEFAGFAEFAPELLRWADARVLFERIELEPRLVICGAGHVGASLARLAALLNYRVTLIDDRAEFISRGAFPEEGIELVLAAGWKESVGAAIGNGRSISIAIVTRGHKEDEECLRAVMSSAPEYIGLIGSKRRTRFVLEKLRAEGFAAARLDQVRAPIGLDIGAVSPEEVALAILAEIVANRRGGRGSPLSGQNRLQ
jgi:xanthine dehydrogenase accessory factor